MAFSDAPTRRKGATYGKKASRSNGLAPASFEALLQRTPQKPKATLPRVHSPARRVAPAPTRDEAVFDVPPSDHEGDDTRLDALLSTPVKKRGRPPGTPTPKRQQRIQGQVSKPRPQTPVSKTTKRKREEHEDAHPRQSGASRPGQRRSTDAQSSTRQAVSTKKQRHSPTSLSPMDEHDDDFPPDRSRAIKDEEMHADDVAALQEPDEAVNPSTDDDILMEDALDPDEFPSQEQMKDDPVEVSARPLPSTPPRQTSSSASSSSKRKATTTPRQQQLWNSLLEDRDSTPVREIQKLKIVSTVKPAPKVDSTAIEKRRLIDTLRSSINSSDPIELSDSDLEDEVESVAMVDAALQPPELRHQDSHVSTSAASGGPASQTFTRAARTYGGERSYLNPKNVDDLLAQPLDADFSPAVAKPAGLTATQKFSNPFDLENDDEEDAGDRVRSFRELRVGGDTRKYDDQMDAVIDDLKDRSRTALSGRRVAVMTLAGYLCSPGFKARFIECNREAEVFEPCAKETDVICGVATSACTILLLQDPVNSQSASHIYDTGIIRALRSLLAVTQDIRKIAKDRKTNMSRVAQQGVDEFLDVMLAAKALSFSKQASINPRMLSMTAIEMLLRRMRESGYQGDLLDSGEISDILQVATEAVQSGSRTIKGETSATQSIVESAFSALESVTITSAKGADTPAWLDDQVRQIAATSSLVLRSQPDRDATLRCLASRLVLNLSNGSERVSAHFADADLLGSLIHRVNKRFKSLQSLALQDDHTVEFDELLLSLGTLFNLCEMSGSIRRIISRSYASVLGDLVQVFNKQREKAKEAESLAESQANVAFGYLAVLLGILAQDSTGLQKIRGKLPKQDIGVLVEAIEEFTMHHQRVDREDSNEIWSVFTTRLKAVADALKTSSAN